MRPGPQEGGRWRFRQLFFNGQRQIRARYPNFDPQDPIYGGWLFTAEGSAEENHQRASGHSDEDALKTFKYRPGTFKRHWAKPREAEVYLVNSPGLSSTIPIKAMDEKSHSITLAHAVKDFMRVPYNRLQGTIVSNSSYYVENVLEELDQPGEWCLDSEDGILYFWPPGSIEGAEVVTPVLDCLIDVRAPTWAGIISVGSIRRRASAQVCVCVCVCA